MFSLTQREQQIVGNVSGSALLLAVVTEAKGHRAEAEVFLVNLKSTTGGHTIGFQFSGAGIHFFDSNFGEFDFPNAADDDHLVAFLNEWWSLAYSNRYHGWKLEGVSTR